MSSRVRTILIGLCVLALFSAAPHVVVTQSAPAQPSANSSATLTGVVTDKNGGFIPGATVVVARMATGEKLPPR